MMLDKNNQKYATLNSYRTNVWKKHTCWPIKITSQQKTKVTGCVWTEIDENNNL